MKAILLINCSLGHENRIINEINAYPKTNFVNRTFGAYDIITELECDGVDEMQELVTDIRRIKEIRSTMTLMVIQK